MKINKENQIKNIEQFYFQFLKKLKKINHLNEILNQFQAKESTEISEEVYNELILEIKKDRIDNLASLTHEQIRDYLKKSASCKC